MAKEYFPEIRKIKFEGKDSMNPMAFRYYDAEKVIMGNPCYGAGRYVVTLAGGKSCQA